MTCIVGLVDHDGQVWMGGDSCSSNGHTYQEGQGHKIFERDGAVIGCTGTFRLVVLLHYLLTISMPREGEDPERYVRCDLLASVKNTLKGHGYLKKDQEVEGFQGPFLFGWRSRLWKFQGDLSVLPAPSWGIAIGSGEEAARGSLHTTRDELDPRLRVLQALEAAEAVVTTVRGPHRIYRVSGSGSVAEVWP